MKRTRFVLVVTLMFCFSQMALAEDTFSFVSEGNDFGRLVGTTQRAFWSGPF